MPTFIVTVTVKSPQSEPVEMRYYRGINHAEALSAMVQAAAHDIADENMPESVRTRVLSVRLDIEHDEVTTSANPLKVGDRVTRNMDGATGTVHYVDSDGVHVMMDATTYQPAAMVLGTERAFRLED